MRIIVLACFFQLLSSISWIPIGKSDSFSHGLQTPNEGINQRSLKIWADVKPAVPKNLRVGVDFWQCIEDDFLTVRP